MKAKRITRVLCWLGGGAIAFVALVGVAHTDLGRPLLALLRGAPGCPIGAEVDPEGWARARARVTASLRGDSPSPSRSVLDVELGATRTEVLAWANDRELRCTALTERLQCPDPVLDGAIRFGFDPQGILVDVERSVRTDRPEHALAAADGLQRDLAATTPPTRVRGRDTVAYLSAGALRQTEREYRFSDMRARVTATNLGARGYLVRGVYQAL